jgi:hypothetical protein
MNFDYYGTLEEANEYFEQRLHETAWSQAVPTNRPKALLMATRIIDTLNYKGRKASVHEYLYTFDDPADADDEVIREKEAEQPLEFPRGEDTEVPEAIRIACYEIAYSLLDGKDPEFELENLSITSQGFQSLRTTYSRNQVPIEHLINGVPNATAWRYLRPFLRDSDAVKLKRV